MNSNKLDHMDEFRVYKVHSPSLAVPFLHGVKLSHRLPREKKERNQTGSLYQSHR